MITYLIINENNETCILSADSAINAIEKFNADRGPLSRAKSIIRISRTLGSLEPVFKIGYDAIRLTSMSHT